MEEIDTIHTPAPVAENKVLSTCSKYGLWFAGLSAGLAIMLPLLPVLFPRQDYAYTATYGYLLSWVPVATLIFCSPLLKALYSLELRRKSSAKGHGYWDIELENMSQQFLALMEGSNPRQMIGAFARSCISFPGVLLVTGGMALGLVVQYLALFLGDSRASLILGTVLIPLIIPLSAWVSLWIWNPRKRLRALADKHNLAVSEGWLEKAVERTGTALQRATSNFLLYRYPFFTGCSGFLAAVIVFVCAPSMEYRSLAQSVTYWLVASARDANMLTDAPLDVSALLAFVTGFLLVVLSAAVAPLAIRLSAFYQLLLQNLFLSHSGGGLWEAVQETTGMRRVQVKVACNHPYIRSFVHSVVWIFGCYAALFSLVAFSSGPVSDAILSWLDFSLRDANILGVSASEHNGLRIFLASIVAGYGTAPVALMSTAFLPGYSRAQILVSAQGLLLPHKGFSAPLKQWRDLRAVFLGNSKRKGREVLTLKFAGSGVLKIQLSKIARADLLEILEAIDEYGDGCSIDQKVVALRRELLGEIMSSTEQTASFSSTIFTPHRSADLILDGKYRVVKQLLSKPLTAVYLARDAEDGLVVLKQFVMPRDDSESKRLEQAFLREYELLSKLDHPSIVKVVDFVKEPSGTYLVLEHVRGEDLRKIVTRCGARNPATVEEWAREIIQQMQYLHSQDPPIIHRDLTPDNVMLDECGRLRIIDFGAAHQFMEGVTGTLIGKQCYIAPEQLRGKAGTKSDIYSFGCTLFFLVTGKDPRALSQCDPSQHISGVPKNLVDVITSCTSFDEKGRPSSFEEVLQMLDGQSKEQLVDPDGLILKLAEYTGTDHAVIDLSVKEHTNE